MIVTTMITAKSAEGMKYSRIPIGVKETPPEGVASTMEGAALGAVCSARLKIIK